MERAHLEMASLTRPMAESSNAIRVVIGDDHAIFRDALRKLLQAEPGFQVVGEAGDGVEATRVLRQVGADILLLDLAMPRHPGTEALRELATSRSEVRSIILAAAVETIEIVEALRFGARGVLLKDSATELLFNSMRSVMAGQYWVFRKSFPSLAEAFGNLLPERRREPRKNTFGLTPRELEIIGTVVAAYSNKEIAQKFSVSEITVKHHLTSVFDKLGVSTRLELVVFAVGHHLVGNVASKN